MSDALRKPMTRQLRVAVVAAEPERAAALIQLVRSFGHTVVASVDEASIVLTDRATNSSHPVVALGVTGGEFQGRLRADASPEQVDAALQAVAAGLSVSDPRFLGPSFDSFHEDDDRVLLTPRETEVLRAVSDGSTNKEVARDLGISQHTVKFHLESLMRKLDVCSRAEAVSKSMRLRLLEPYRL